MAKPSNLRIEDVGAADARADLNDILISIASLQTTDGAGTGYTGEPTTTYPNMLWYDKATDILKMRSEADDAWITLGTLDQSLDTFAASIALATQAEAEAGTNNTKAMTPLRTAQAIEDRTRVLAMCAFDGTGTGTLSVESNGLNVSNVTKNGTGDYTINFTASLPHANYAVSGMSVDPGSDLNSVVQFKNSTARAVGSVRLVNIRRDGNEVDSALITITVVG